MSHSYSWEAEGLYRRFSGSVSGDEILASNFETHADHRFGRIKYIINDFTAVTSIGVEREHTAIYAKTDDIIASTKGHLKIALVVRGAEQRMLASAYCEQMQDKRFDCQLFDRLEDARQWVSAEAARSGDR